MSRIFALPPKIQPAADIQLPPNFEMYSKGTEKVEEVNLNLPSRLGENNPLVFPSIQSTPINFEGSEMGRLNLDNLLNPHKNDIEFMEKELKEYRQQVQAKNEEFKRLERQRNEIKSYAQGEHNADYDYLQQQREEKQAELMRIQAEKQALLNALKMKQSAVPDARVVNSPPPPPPQPAIQNNIIAAPYDDFFERKEIIKIESAEVVTQGFQNRPQAVVAASPQVTNSYQFQQAQYSPQPYSVNQSFNLGQPHNYAVHQPQTYNTAQTHTFTTTTQSQPVAQPRPSGMTFVNQIAPQQPSSQYTTTTNNQYYGQPPKSGGYY